MNQELKTTMKKAMGSRKALVFFVIAGINILLKLVLAFLGLSEQQSQQVDQGLDNATELAIAYIASQAGVDLAGAWKKES